jgi:hypothetical protein
MSTLLENHPTARRRTATTPAEQLQAAMAATRVSFTWFGVRKTLSTAQKEQAADSFAAEGRFLSAAKKLLDVRHDAYQAVTAVRGRAVTYWKSMSLPFPEPGIRLIRHEDLAKFDEQLQIFRADLGVAVHVLQNQYAELKESARQRLGSLFNPRDYPESLLDEFAISWDFPSVQAPEYLRRLNPELYQKECERMQQRFQEAVSLAEHAFLDELARLVDHLTERIAGNVDGKPKIFRDSVIENLTEFFERFQRLNIRSNTELDELVQQTQRIVQGVAPQQLRDNQSLRQSIATQMSTVQATLDGLLVDRPRRSILRPKQKETD